MSFARPPTTAAAPPPQSTSPAVPDGAHPVTTQQLQPQPQVVNGQVLVQQPPPQGASHAPPHVQGIQSLPGYANGMPSVLPGSLQSDPNAHGAVAPQAQHPQALHPQGPQNSTAPQSTHLHQASMPPQHAHVQQTPAQGQASTSHPGVQPSSFPSLQSVPSTVYSHGAAVPLGQTPPRLNELLESVKQEFLQVSAEASRVMMQKDDVDTKLIEQHMSELTQVRKTIYELDQAHRQMRDRYEEELQRLRKKLDQSNPQPPPVFSVRFHKEAAASNGDSEEGSQGLPLPLPRRASLEGDKRQLGATPGSQALSPGANSSAGQPDDVSNAQASQAAEATGPAARASTTPTDASKNSSREGPASSAPSTGTALPPAASAIPTSAPAAPLPPTPTESVGGAASGDAEARSDSGATDAKDPKDPKEAAEETKSSGNQDIELPDAPVTEESRADNAEHSSDEAAAKNKAAGTGLATLDFDTLAPEYKKDAGDFRVVYNKDAAARCDVELVKSLQHGSVVCCVRFNSDGTLLATGCNRSAQIYDVETGELKARLEDPSVDSTDLYIRSVCFSPDSRYLATGTEDHKVRVWNIEKREIRLVFEGHDQDIYSLSYSNNGKFIASGSGDRNVRLWDVDSGECIRTFEIEDGVTAVAISHDDRFVAAGSLDRTVRLWDIEKGEQVERLALEEPHEDSVYSVAFRPGTNEIVSGSLDKTVKVWTFSPEKPNEGRTRLTVTGHEDYVLSVCATHEGSWVLSGSKDRTVQMWDANSGEAQLLLQAHNNSVISVAPSPKQDMFASGSGDFTAKIWRYKPRT